MLLRPLLAVVRPCRAKWSLGSALATAIASVDRLDLSDRSAIVRDAVRDNGEARARRQR